MDIYDVSGNAVLNAYGADGNALSKVYDITGGVIWAELTVVEYNVGQWYYGGGDNVPASKDAEYYALQNGMIKNADADFLLICEYWDNMSKLPRTAESMLSQYYPYIQTYGGASGYYGRAICSKYPLTNYTRHYYTNDANRYYDSVEASVNGTPITLVVTHLSTDSKRNAQIAELISFLSALDSFVCAGDFNTLTITGSVTTSAEDYTNIILPLLNAGFNCANCSALGFLITYSDSPGGPYVGCLDNIVTSHDIAIRSARVDTTKLNDNLTERADHMPLIASVVITQ